LSFLKATVVPSCSSPWRLGSPQRLSGFFMSRLLDGSGASSCGYTCCEDARGLHGGIGCRWGHPHLSLSPSFMTIPFAVDFGRQ
jgi:hypothetical protein